MSTALDVSLKVLYVQGPAVEVDQAAAEQLRTASAELQITTIAGPAAALAELRRTPGWQALFASPSLQQNEVLALIASLRRDRIPIAIVPILDEAHQDLFASAVATGADDVLVRRSGTLVNINETLTRIRQSPHLFPAEQRRRISVLYAGRDPLVWNLLDQVPFVKAERVATGIDGTCPVRRPGSSDDSLRADAVIIDEAPGDAHPLQVLKSVKAQASDLPVIVLTSAGAADIATAALELGADDTVLKTGIFRRRLIATLRRVHQRLELNAQQHETKTREERLRQIVENVPTGIMVLAGDGRVLAMNAAALHLFAASKPRDIVGRDFLDMVDTADRESLTGLIRQVTKGEGGGLVFDAHTLAGQRLQARIDAVVLERDARGGRGLVASVTRAAQAPAGGVADGASAAELATLRDSLETLERHYAELEDARAHERAAWESERQRLEARLEEAERLAAERRTIADRLDEVTDELARTSQSFVEERQSLEQRLQELESAARETSAVGATRAELEHALETVREELRQAIAAHALERSGWQDIRTELETRVRQLDHLHQTEQDTLVASLQEDVRRLEQTLTEERARWETTHRQLESELRNAREALWAEHTERDATRATFEAELGALRATLDAERANRQEALSALDGDLAAARATADATAAERDRVRTELEQKLLEAQAALEHERADWQATLETLDDARRQIEVALEHERAEWTDQRLAFEDERRHLLERGVQAGDLAAERSRLEAELDTARQQWSVERAALESDRTRATEQAERAEEALRALTDEYDATRARLEAQHDQARAELDDFRATVEAQLRHLEAELAAAREQVTAVSTERDALRERSTAEVTALERVRSEDRDGWQQRLTALEVALARATETLSQHESRWQQERAQLLQAAADARTYAEQERGHLVSLHARELEEWREAVDQARSERDRASSRLTSVEADLDVARAQLTELDDVRPALEAARADRDQAHQRVAALEDELQDVRHQLGELDQLRAALDAARNDHQRAVQRVAALEGEVDGARAEHQQARLRAHTLETELAELRTSVAEHQNLLDALEAARSEIRHTDAAHHAEREEWQRSRRAMEHDLRELEARLHNERDAWSRTRAELEAEAGEAARLVRDQQFLNDTIAALRADCSALAGSLADERADHDRHQQELEGLRAAVADSRARLAEMDAAVDRAARSANEQLVQERARHQARERDLEGELRDLSAHLGQARADAEAMRDTLHASRTRASDNHARLVASDAFGYAVTTLAGELVRCNDAFARVFGYTDAAEAQARTAGRPFPGLAARPHIATRLGAEGHVDRVVSCVERIDGRAVRIIETATVLAGEREGDPSLVEHVVVAGPAGPTPEAIQTRRLKDVGALTTAMMPELESLSATVQARSADLVKSAGGRRTASDETEQLRGASEQVATLVRQLAAFSRRQVRDPEPIDIGEAVRAAEPVLTRLAGDYIGFSTELGPTTAITAQPEDVEQLLTSMVALGRDLLPAGGSITVQTRQQDAGAADALGVPGPVLAVKASGYGVQFPDATTALEFVAGRCGGTVRVAGETGRVVRIEIVFPRCGMPASW